MYRVQYISAVKLAAAAIDKRTLALVPSPIAEQRQVVPVLLDRQRSVLTVVTSDPDDVETLKELEIATQVRTIRALIARPAAVEAAVRKFYLGDDFAFSLLRNENYDMARALERDPLATLQGPRNETILSERGIAGPVGEMLGPSDDGGRLSYPGSPHSSGQYAATSRTPMSQVVPTRPADVLINVTGARRLYAPTPTAPPAIPPYPSTTPGRPSSPTPPPRSLAPPMPQRPSVVARTQPSPEARRVVLTPPPPPPDELDPSDLSPLPMTLSPALARSEPPPR